MEVDNQEDDGKYCNLGLVWEKHNGLKTEALHLKLKGKLSIMASVFDSIYVCAISVPTNIQA